MNEAYPVLGQFALAPVPHNLAGYRLRLARLPRHDPGTVRVYRVGGNYFGEAEGDRPLRWRVVAAAESVSIVDIWPRTLQIGFQVEPVEGCEIRVGFRCHVVDPAAVAQRCLSNLFPDLDAYLHQSLRLRWLAAASNLDRLGEVYLLIQQRLSAQFTVRPPTIPGVKIGLAFIHIGQ